MNLKNDLNVFSLFEEMPRVGRKIKIICTEHDETFEQEPRRHMRGHTGCYECKVNKLSGIKGELGKFKSQSELNKSCQQVQSQPLLIN